MTKLIEFHSSAFPFNHRDRELVNCDSMHGYALARYIGFQLWKEGLPVSRYVGEDWGWYCEVPTSDFTLAYGVMAYERSEEFLIQFIPHKPYIRKWFRKVDISGPMVRLQEAVFEALKKAPSSSTPKWIGA